MELFGWFCGEKEKKNSFFRQNQQNLFFSCKKNGKDLALLSLLSLLLSVGCC
jgi:hypothetical protein